MFLQSCVNFRFHYFYFLYSIQHVYSGFLGRAVTFLCQQPIRGQYPGHVITLDQSEPPVTFLCVSSRKHEAVCLPSCRQIMIEAFLMLFLSDRWLFTPIILALLGLYCFIYTSLEEWKVSILRDSFKNQITNSSTVNKQATFHFWAVQNCFILLDFPAVNNFLTRVDMGHLAEGKWPKLWGILRPPVMLWMHIVHLKFKWKPPIKFWFSPN